MKIYIQNDNTHMMNMVYVLKNLLTKIMMVPLMKYSYIQVPVPNKMSFCAQIKNGCAFLFQNHKDIENFFLG